MTNKVSTLTRAGIRGRDFEDVDGDRLIETADFHNGSEDPWNGWCEPCRGFCTGECMNEEPDEQEA